MCCCCDVFTEASSSRAGGHPSPDAAARGKRLPTVSKHVTDQGRRPIDTCGRVGGQGREAGSVRPARARGQEGGPAPGKGSRHGAAHTRRHTSRTRPRQPLHEVHGFRAEAPANLKRKDHQPAARVRAKELRVCALLGPSGVAQGCTLGSVLVAPRDTCRGQGRHQRGMHSKLHAIHRGKPLAVTSIRRSSPGTLPTFMSLTNVCVATTSPASRQMRAAPPFKRAAPCSQDTRSRTCSAVIAKSVLLPSTPASRRDKRQGQAQASRARRRPLKSPLKHFEATAEKGAGAKKQMPAAVPSPKAGFVAELPRRRPPSSQRKRQPDQLSSGLPDRAREREDAKKRRRRGGAIWKTRWHERWLRGVQSRLPLGLPLTRPLVLSDLWRKGARRPSGLFACVDVFDQFEQPRASPLFGAMHPWQPGTIVGICLRSLLGPPRALLGKA